MHLKSWKNILNNITEEIKAAFGRLHSYETISSWVSTIKMCFAYKDKNSTCLCWFSALPMPCLFIVLFFLVLPFLLFLIFTCRHHLVQAVSLTVVRDQIRLKWSQRVYPGTRMINIGIFIPFHFHPSPKFVEFPDFTYF